ncbi:MAG: UDP-N-acetylmuramate dehydrogenase [Ignavibacteria bacterium]
MISISEIQEIFKGKVTLNERLARFTTFRIGGDSDFYLEPADEEDLLNIIKYANQKNLSFYIIGNGSNILISDEGIRGLVINLEKGFGYLEHENGLIICGAGVKIAKFVDFCIQNNYAGVEMLAGIPATMGGALVMNAGAYGGEISAYVVEVGIIRKDKIKSLTKEECGFVYRNSDLKDTVIMYAKFKLPHGDPEKLSKIRKDLLLKRNEAQPVEIPNAGSIFKNPEGDFAARLVEQCGLKGARFGGAMVSPKHANFIVNFDNASANDVIELIKVIRKAVKEKFGILLELEVKLIGFQEMLV